MSLRDALTKAVVEPVEPFGGLSAELGALVTKSLLGQLDSKTIIEAGPAAARIAPKTCVALDSGTVSAVTALEAVLQTSAALTATLAPLLAGFGRVLEELTGSGSSGTRDAEMTARRSAFLMTDMGGPSIADWQSTCSPAGGRLALTIRKQWAIGADDFDTAIVLVRGAQSQYPLLIRLTADDCRTLVKTRIGAPFLDGRLQLGNVAGEVTVSDAQVMRKNPVYGTRVFLSIIRPRFVRAVMAHLRWLHGTARVALSDEESAHVGELANLAAAVGRVRSFALRDMLAATSVKLVANELLHAIAARRFADFDDHSRDFLGLAKMEGSSYRCLYELLAYQGVLR